MSIADIVANIDQRLTDLNAEIAQLSSARSALSDTPAPTASAQTHRAHHTPAGDSYDVVPAGKLIATLQASDVMRTRELSHATNGAPSQLLALLKEQEDAGQVRRTGTRAATRWHAITNQDRIAARTADLERNHRRGHARKT